MKLFVESEIRVKATIRQILDALLEVDQLKEWWGVNSGLIQRKDGGIYTITWLKSEQGIKFISTGRIKLLDRHSHLHLEDMIYINSEKGILGPFTIQYNMEAHKGYSIIKVKQGGFEKGQEHEWYYQAVLEGWPQALIMLKRYLEKRYAS